VHKSEKKEVCGQPTAETRARARDGSWSRWGALAEQGEAGSGQRPRPPPRPALPFWTGGYCPCTGESSSNQSCPRPGSKQSLLSRLARYSCLEIEPGADRSGVCPVVFKVLYKSSTSANRIVRISLLSVCLTDYDDHGPCQPRDDPPSPYRARCSVHHEYDEVRASRYMFSRPLPARV
jgi:hypothetical protein